MSDYKDVVENEVKEALTKTENDLKAKLEEKREAEREIEEISEAICRIDNEYSEVGERVTEIQMGIRKVRSMTFFSVGSVCRTKKNCKLAVLKHF